MNVPISRRDFFKASAVAGAALAAGNSATAAPLGKAKSCIFLMLTGGPSQLDTWDPKPDAPSDVRGPFSPIRTAVPGMHVSELFPKMAAMADKFSLIRTMHHEHAPIHENGFQLLNTGRCFGEGEWPWIGSVVDSLKYDNDFGQRSHILNGATIDTGIPMDIGLSTAWTEWPSPPVHERDRPCLLTDCELALRAVEVGFQFCTINHFSTVFDTVTWDCHADRGSLRTTLGDYRNEIAPAFDSVLSLLLARLDDKGLLDSTLVVAVGEFGRTPKLNCHGGRDHWANCWTAIVAGGGTQGGRIIGESDATAGEPKDRPVHCSELVATIYHALGISHATTLPGPDGKPVRVVEAQPVMELF